MSGEAPIGYYVHHHGAGHVQRFKKIANASDRIMVPISELEIAGGVRLPSDVVEDGLDHSAGGSLHWAPVGDPQSATRAHAFGKWLTEARLLGVVVDVSVEAALLCRLFGVRTICVRQHGDRTDAAHAMAYRSSVRLLAPFPVELEHPLTPPWVCAKTIYAGFIGTTRRNRCDSLGSGELPARDDVVILWGKGGGALDERAVAQIARAAAPNKVWFAGEIPFDLSRYGVCSLGWVDDVAGVLEHAPTVVGSAGNNVVADAAAAGCALAVVPQHRPFHEQERHAESLEQHEVAAVAWGHDPRWDLVLDDAQCRRSKLAALADTQGADRAAHAIIESFDAVAGR